MDMERIEQAAYNEGYRRGKADRPQGEWIKEGCAKGSEMCNQCGFVQFEGRVDNFCPNCGAKMDGERKESE